MKFTIDFHMSNGDVLTGGTNTDLETEITVIINTIIKALSDSTFIRLPGGTTKNGNVWVTSTVIASRHVMWFEVLPAPDELD